MTLQRKSLLSSRKRLADEGEDEDGVFEHGEDSQSETSALSADEAMYADASSNDADPPAAELQTSRRDAIDGASSSTKRKGKKRKAGLPSSTASNQNQTSRMFTHSAETSAMINGLQSNGNLPEEEAIDFEDLGKTIELQNSERSLHAAPKSIGDSQLGPQPSQLDQDQSNALAAPKPIPPSRGNYFMHDDRNTNFGASRDFPLGRGRGRSRGSQGNPPSSFGRRSAPFLEADKARWTHDLHDTITAPKPPGISQRTEQVNAENAEILTSPLSKSIAVATVSIRVLLPSMAAPVYSSKMKLRQHTRLPDLRPPLRRDKPVRISLPGRPSTVQWPSVDRSFIFIPRTQRPGYQKSRSRGLGNRSLPDSRRTSVYGGSVYTPSIAMSRRSSQAREGYGTPSATMSIPQQLALHQRSARPIVKLPSGPEYLGMGLQNNAYGFSYDGSTPSLYAQQNSWQPPPPPPSAQTPYQEAVPNNIPMHQPRPQKAVTVASIESPRDGTLNTAERQDEQQPFHHQVPMHIKSPSAQPTPQQFPHSRQLSMQGVQPATSPLTNIPEGAINAQAFQPLMVPQQPYYSTSYAVPPMYYYGPPQMPSGGQQNAYNSNNMTSPVYMQQGPYYMPMYVPQTVPVGDASAGVPNGLIAHESNGMVYYLDPSQVPNSPPNEAGGYPMHGSGGGYFYTQPPQSMSYYTQH